MKSNKNYTIKSFPSSRQFTLDISEIGMRKHHVKALIEIDVTDARIKIKKNIDKFGKKISFTSWILKCIAQAVSEHKQVHALRKGKNKLIIFDEIDMSIVVEKKVYDDFVPIPLVIRNVNNLEISDIYDVIENAKSTEVKNSEDYVIEKGRKQGFIKLFLLFPQFIRLIFWKILLSNPYRVKKMMGTIAVTSIGMIGEMSGWFIPFSIHPLCFAIGSIVKKPTVEKNEIVIKELLEITILVDHDVIDGAPAARFASRLSELIQNSFAL